MSPALRVTGLFVYPVKSLRGTAVETLELGPRGPRFDRHWMLVDEAGRFLTQRTRPLLARLSAHLTPTTLRVEGPGTDALELEREAPGPARTITVWKDTFEALDCGDGAAAWFTEQVGAPCRLVRMRDDVRRPLDPTYSPSPEAHTAFADAYPVLLAHEASLRELNARLTAKGEAPVPMNRFRANVVVEGGAPWAEDDWRELQLGDVHLDLVKPCARCVVTTTDQESGQTHAEPLRTLAAYRQQAPFGVIFGQNAVHRAPGVVRLGDSARVLR
jgi:hypothetical protein